MTEAHHPFGEEPGPPTNGRHDATGPHPEDTTAWEPEESSPDVGAQESLPELPDLFAEEAPGDVVARRPEVPAEEAPPPFPVPDEVADYSVEELAPALAAVCFALNRSVTLGEAAAILGRSQADVGRAADHLAATLRGGGLMLQRHQDELQIVTRPEVAWAVQRALNPEKPGRLSRAALETLAIVAYRQPLTRAAVEAIRGVNCEGVLDSLERRGLIAEVGRQDTPGHPRLFGTTLRFLQVVGLERIEGLPPLPEGLKVPELPAADWAEPGGPEAGEAETGDDAAEDAAAAAEMLVADIAAEIAADTDAPADDVAEIASEIAAAPADIAAETSAPADAAADTDLPDDEGTVELRGEVVEDPPHAAADEGDPAAGDGPPAP